MLASDLCIRLEDGFTICLKLYLNLFLKRTVFKVKDIIEVRFLILFQSGSSKSAHHKT